MPKSLKPVNKKRPLQQSKLTSKKPTQSPMPLTIFKNIGTLLTLQGARIKQGRKITESDLSIIPNAAIVIEGEVIKWAGPEKNLQKDFLSKNKIKKIKSIDIQGRTVLPGLIEYAFTFLVILAIVRILSVCPSYKSPASLLPLISITLIYFPVAIATMSSPSSRREVGE